jgi:CRP-like cAMP-binding protein
MDLASIQEIVNETEI